MNESSNKTKTIAFYIGSLTRGGAERVMTNLARYFTEQDYTVYLVTKKHEGKEYEVPDGVTRIIADITEEEESKSRVVNLYRRIMKLRSVWREIKPNIIVSFIRKNNLMAIASSRFLKIPVLVAVRANPKVEFDGRLFEQISFFMFRFADGIIMQTTQGVEYLPKYLQKKATIMKNSLTKQFINREISTNRVKEIAMVGRFDAYKNQRMLLEVFSELRSEYPEWSLHFYGDGEFEEELKNKYACDQIIFHGHTSDIIECIKDTAIFAFPPKAEGMPNALIESMALGLACISTDCPCGGPADLIDDGVNGILVPVDNPKEFGEKLRLLMDDEALRERLGSNAVKIVEKLNPDNVNAEWKQYIEQFI